MYDTHHYFVYNTMESYVSLNMNKLSILYFYVHRKVNIYIMDRVIPKKQNNPSKTTVDYSSKQSMTKHELRGNYL